jgi:hypothetical protein
MIRAPLFFLRVLCFGPLLAITAYYLYGFLDHSWNPFAVVASDTSGNFRYLEYEIARYFLMENPISGVGIAVTNTDTQWLTGNRFFAASDLGTIGVWWDFGLVGLSAFLLASWLVCNPSNYGQNNGQILTLTSCSLVLYGTIAPIIFYPGGATYFAFALGIKLSTLAKRAK